MMVAAGLGTVPGAKAAGLLASQWSGSPQRRTSLSALAGVYSSVGSTPWCDANSCARTDGRSSASHGWRKVEIVHAVMLPTKTSATMDVDATEAFVVAIVRSARGMGRA